MQNKSNNPTTERKYMSVKKLIQADTVALVDKRLLIYA